MNYYKNTVLDFNRHLSIIHCHTCRHPLFSKSIHGLTKTHPHTHTHSQTQPHFIALWHKMGFLCLSRGGPMATEGHIKKWGLYNRWCQIGCQLQHKWPSITSEPRVKSPLYRWLDFRQKRRKKPPHSSPLHCPAGGIASHAHRGLHSCIHAQHTAEMMPPTWL